MGGARNVICCAWPVKQIVAEIMMDRLYKNMCESGDGENGTWKIGKYPREVLRWFRRLDSEECGFIEEGYDPKGKCRYGIGDNKHFYNWGTFMIVGPPD